MNVRDDSNAARETTVRKHRAHNKIDRTHRILGNDLFLLVFQLVFSEI